jgi:hypothetical protein
MSRSRFRAILLLLVAALLLQGCTYNKLVRPEPQIASTDSVRASRANTAKFAYSTRWFSSDFHGSSALIEKALLDSLSAFGIHDVIKSEKLEQDRVNIIAYSLGPEATDTTPYFNVYIEIPWALISLGTLFVVPIYGEDIYPVEIHVIIPSREYDKQLKIIRTEYAISSWTWLPFLFMPNDETREDVHYGAMFKKPDYLGWRRIFDGVVMDCMSD